VSYKLAVSIKLTKLLTDTSLPAATSQDPRFDSLNKTAAAAAAAALPSHSKRNVPH